jgi:hypothetical protein
MSQRDGQNRDALVQRMQVAVPVVVDMACLHPEKVAKLVVKTWQRRLLENELARKHAIAELRSELKSEVTGVLLTTQMVLKRGGLSAGTNEGLTAVLEIAPRLKDRLETKTR